MTKHIVNPAGYVHDVEDEAAEGLLGQDGYRLATKDEVNNYLALQGLTVPKSTAKPKPAKTGE